MSITQTRLAWPAFFAATVLMGGFFWVVPYHMLELCFWPMAGVVFMTAVLLHACVPQQPAVRPAALAMLAVYIIRLPVDWVDDPTHHNLWPIGLVITALAAFAAAWAGVLSVRAWRWLRSSLS